ncbi:MULTISPECIES: MauE/DoxX family redox-associated membrane protein [unclassified Flavobacterium]|uniref:MauE/DoxX family redox-associated membrane protein n=1 Tax=unclassified Flavobacterium TaxID=196869 RepID=UPI001F1303A1|nr:MULTISPECIES: MauE/DoxX family redox-associated membrane protein [unclassified Flavobacterium]UMY64578.1 protein tlpB [Flavobacterium sp. HJ-32-4]
MKKQDIAWVLRIIVALLFLVSAVAKLYPSPYFAISTFEVKQLYPMGFTEEVARYFSRTLIGIEFALGVLLLQRHFLRTLVVPATFLLLLVFVVHLTIQTYVFGNGGNCGCFGELLPMTPVEAIIKNIVAMGLLGWLYALLPKTGERSHNAWVLSTGLLAFILMVFMLAPMQPVSQPLETNIPIAEDTLPEPTVADTTAAPEVTVAKTDTVAVEKPKTIDAPASQRSGYAAYFADVDKGKTTLCFFVPGCDHCRDAAKELTEMKRRNKNAPKIEILFMNEEAEKIPEFFEYAGATYPYKIIEIIPFWKLLGEGKDTPGVKYLWNGHEYVYYYGIEGNKFNAAAYEKLIHKPFAELAKP